MEDKGTGQGIVPDWMKQTKVGKETEPEPLDLRPEAVNQQQQKR
jgi:hypothetical protein